MKIETIKVGYLKANCYILTQNNKSIIIDPGDEAEKIITACNNKNVIGVLITHHHPDHIGALEQIKKKYNILEEVNISDFKFETIKTPGHSSDSVTYYFPEYKVLFTGDFIFEGTIGRMDFPTGSTEDMKNSLELISKYPEECIIYPGHGNATTLSEEKKRFKNYGI